ncbi:MAG: ketoacyl-ACP synthase III [Bacteroidetes bacterium]|nr:MAG: ketoacyl-ACP synthase III [Bacteroidota bacterium]
MSGTQRYAVITGSGSYLPTRRIPNSYFHQHQFLDEEGNPFERSPEEIVARFTQITDIYERRYAKDEYVASDLGYFAAKDALDAAGTDGEDLDYIIVAHNWGDITPEVRRADQVPTVAARIKHKLGIANPYCVAYDLPFGCPGWVQGVIQANYYIRSGDAQKALVIGAETLSRVVDPHDRDSMIYADGAGAVVVEARESEEPVGIVSHLTRTDAKQHAYLLWQGVSYNKDLPKEEVFVKMHGHKLYKYALRHVPELVQATLEKADIHLSDVKKILIHQANAKMDEAIVSRLFKLYKEKYDPESGLMPLTVPYLGNSSVATVPTLYDLIVRGNMKGHSLPDPGEWMVLASVGAGMHVNAVAYRMPGA